MPFIYYLSPDALWVLKNSFALSISKPMSPKRRYKWRKAEQKDPLLDLDTKVRAALTSHRDRCFKDDWWPRQGSEDEALLTTYGLDEFIQGIIEEEERFKKDWYD